MRPVEALEEVFHDRQDPQLLSPHKLGVSSTTLDSPIKYFLKYLIKSNSISLKYTPPGCW